MSDRQLKLHTTTTAGGSKPSTTTINNVNPNATGEVMKNYAKMLNRFTTNTYNSTELVETTNLDTETVKLRFNLRLNSTTGQIVDGRVYLDYSTDDGQRYVEQFGMAFDSNGNAYLLKSEIPKKLYLPTTTPGKYTILIGVASLDDNYYGDAIRVPGFTVTT